MKIEESILLDLRAGTPSEQQLVTINKYRNAGSPEYTAEEIYQFPTIASDNLLHQNNSQWSKRSLESMAKTLVGKDFLLNHDWNNSNKIQGTVFDSAIVNITDLSLATKLFLIESSPNQVSDLEILTKDGYEALILWVAVEANSGVASDVVYLRKSDLSVGGFAGITYICPLCNVSFNSNKCPHIIPDPSYMYQMGIDRYDPDLAPYYIRDGNFQGVELSLVVEGNCPRARILREIDLEKLSLKRF